MTTTKLKLNMNRVLLTRTLMVAIFCTAVLYVYFVGAIAFAAETRSQISDSISQYQSEISELEFSLINEARSINRASAVGMGLVQSVENEVVVVMRDSKTRLTFNE